MTSQPTDDQLSDDVIPAPTDATPEATLDAARRLVDALVQTVQPWLFRHPAEPLLPQMIERLAAWYARSETAEIVRYAVLRTWAVDGSPQALALLAERLTAAPPSDARQAVSALLPLFQPRDDRLPGATALFPRLFDGLTQPMLAPAVLDLANFFVRRGYLTEHPAKGRTGELASLLSSLVSRLATIEEDPGRYASSPTELSKVVNDAVTLVVSLCDALALAGDVEVVGKLNQAAALAHRRVQTEAAAALARLGEKSGVEQLKKLAAESSARPRVLAYLEELGVIGELDESLRSVEARAQGELAAWMTQPTRFGLAPDELELIDRVKQYWPGYVDPVDCFLFTYEYNRGGRTAAGVGIAGPMTSALQFDLQDLPPGDIYALYAGLDAEHDEIFDVPLDELDDGATKAWDFVHEALAEQGFTEIELVRWGSFFGEYHAVATAVREGRRGVVIVADEAAEWIALPTAARGFGPNEAYALYKGRKLLKSFNEEPR